MSLFSSAMDYKKRDPQLRAEAKLIASGGGGRLSLLPAHADLLLCLHSSAWERDLSSLLDNMLVLKGSTIF